MGGTDRSILFGSGYGFGGAFAYPKQVAAFAAQVTQSYDPTLSVSLAYTIACRGTPEPPHGVVQKCKVTHPIYKVAFRQGF